MQPLGKYFIDVIKLFINPIILLTMVTGICGMGDLKKVGKVGGKALLYFEIITTLALFIGIGVGYGINLNNNQVISTGPSIGLGVYWSPKFLRF